jgi:two-component system chemotaxis response regulator CheB
MKNAGAFTIAQDEKSSIVFGMPKEAIKLGGAHKVVALDKIADEIKKNI